MPKEAGMLSLNSRHGLLVIMIIFSMLGGIAFFPPHAKAQNLNIIEQAAFCGNIMSARRNFLVMGDQAERAGRMQLYVNTFRDFIRAYARHHSLNSSQVNRAAARGADRGTLFTLGGMLMQHRLVQALQECASVGKRIDGRLPDLY
jgi:hypothetical protein